MEITKSSLAHLASIGLAGLLLASCAIGPDAHSKRFHEEQFADLIIRYSTDQTIYRLRPEGRDGAFFRIFNREQIRAEAKRLGGRRFLAVVMIDYMHAPFLEQELIDSWVADFRELNFQRVVFVRAKDYEMVNGLRIVADIPLSQTARPQTKPSSLESL
jgi:hypothetical protein